MRTRGRLCAGGVLAVFLLTVGVLGARAQSASAPAKPQVIVAVHLRDPHFRTTEAKFRVVYNQTEDKSVDLAGYDFHAAFSDELAATLAGDPRARWRLPSGDEQIFLRSYFEEKTAQGTLPATVEASRLLLVEVRRYGLLFHIRNYFYIDAEFKMVERSTGRILWKKRIYNRSRDKDKNTLEQLSADNQKLLKENLNRAIEEYCAEARKEVAKKPI